MFACMALCSFTEISISYAGCVHDNKVVYKLPNPNHAASILWRPHI